VKGGYGVSEMPRQESLAFGEAAELYDATRPGYPAAVFDKVLGAVARPRRVLEIGAGTGKATMVLAARGVEVEAIEPDSRMAAIARQRTEGLAVDVRELDFEAWDGPPGTFDLVVCAQAWHWIDPVRGAIHAARALRRDGALAIWWTRPRAVRGQILAALRDVYRSVAPSLVNQTSLLAVEAGVDVPRDLPLFGPWRSRSFRWSQVFDAGSYAELIQTQGDHRLLPLGQLIALVAAVEDVIDRVGGGHIEYVFSTDLSIAKPLVAGRDVQAVINDCSAPQRDSSKPVP
jgi:SAM-dependent methyltransferase